MRSAATCCCLLLAGCAAQDGASAQPVAPLPFLHAHNDYLHARPLRDALAQGFCSVEADVFLDGGELRVGHERWQLRPGRTLEALYLEPLAERCRQNGGRVFAGGPVFTLLVDIKADGAAVYERLRETLARYRDLLCRWRDDSVTEGAVRVILSGDRPRELVAGERERLVAIDGRLADLAGSASPFLVPLISDAWEKVSEWDGKDEPTELELAKLRALAAKAHAQGRQLRFWGAPDRAEVWTAQGAAGVDLLGTDRLRDAAAWARAR